MNHKFLIACLIGLLSGALFMSAHGYGAEQYHFLWVLDNGGSLANQRNLLRDHVPQFLEVMNSHGNIDYRMGVTTTDMFVHQGKLVVGEKGQKYVQGTDNDPVEQFQSIINNVTSSPTSFWEQGLESSFQALNGDASDLLEDGVPLIVVYVTDEDDYSCKDKCFGVEPENNKDWIPYELDRYVSFFQSLAEKRNINVSIFPLVSVLESTCTVSSYGIRYLKVLAQTASGFGKPGSICEDEIVRHFLSIAEQVASGATPKPPVWNGSPIDLGQLIPGYQFSYNLSVFVSGNGVTFSPVSLPKWLSLESKGTLSGIPSDSDVGTFIMSIRATDKWGQSADGKLFGEVLGGIHHPVKWMLNPVAVGKIIANQTFKYDLSAYVSNPEAVPLVFRVVGGPSWVTLNSKGTLRGKPTSADVGLFSLVVQVSGNFSGVIISDTTTVSGEVLDKP